MDVIESNEAFAAQALAVSCDLKFDPKKTNPNGGAVGLGHPIGATGAVLTVKALYELQRTGGRYALVTMCIGGGQGIAAVFERMKDLQWRKHERRNSGPAVKGLEGAGRRHRQRAFDRLRLRGAFRELGADLAITYLNEKARPYVEPLAHELEAPIFLPLDVSMPGELEAVFERIAQEWGRLDILVHSIAWAPKDDLQGGLLNCSAEGFAKAMDISCHSFVRMARLAAPLMNDGGTMFAMSYHGAQKVVANYNVMGPDQGGAGSLRAAISPTSSGRRRSACTRSRRGRSRRARRRD